MKVEYSEEAKKQLEKLPPQELRKVFRKVQALELSASEGKKLQGNFAGLRSLKAWPYRIIYHIITDGVRITSVKHRQGVYK